MNRRLIVSLAMGAVTTIALLLLIMVLREYVIPFNELLTGITGHHWTSKSLFIAIAMPACSAAFYFFSKRKPSTVILPLLILGSVAILAVGFMFALYTLHFFIP